MLGMPGYGPGMGLGSGYGMDGGGMCDYGHGSDTVGMDMGPNGMHPPPGSYMGHGGYRSNRGVMPQSDMPMQWSQRGRGGMPMGGGYYGDYPPGMMPQHPYWRSGSMSGAGYSQGGMQEYPPVGNGPYWMSDQQRMRGSGNVFGNMRGDAMGG